MGEPWQGGADHDKASDVDVGEHLGRWGAPGGAGGVVTTCSGDQPLQPLLFDACGQNTQAHNMYSGPQKS